MPVRSPNIFVGTCEIAGIMNGIAHCLRQQGLTADLYLTEEHRFSYEQSSNFNPNPHFRRMIRIRKALLLNPEGEQLSRLQELHKKTMILMMQDLLKKYDVFIFNGWQTIFPNYEDLPLLRQHGKKIIIFFLGSEGRPQWMQGPSLNTKMDLVLSRTQQVFNRVRALEYYSDCIVSHPPTSQFCSKPFIPFLGIGFPFPKPDTTLTPIWPERPLVLHAPSSPYKGSARIKAAMETLKQEGLQFDFLELKGVPNSVVLEHLARCSFVVDELYSDSLLAGLGTEAAHFGKPTLVGSLPDLEDTMRGSDMPPPPCETFRDGNPLPGMRRLLKDPDYTRRLGEQACNYVNSYWSIEEIGRKLAALVSGDLSPELLCRPEDINYFRGWGLSDEEFHRLVSQYIKTFGHKALYISDKPRLLLSLLHWLKGK